MSRFAVVDVETTGMEADDEVVQIGVVILADLKIEAVSRVYVMPDKEIPPPASAVHHITLDTLAKADPIYTREAASDWLKIYTANCEAVIAHNAKFDSMFLPELCGKLPWVCTLVCAKHLWPDNPYGYSLQVLRYWLKLKTPYLVGEAHMAEYDACVTAHLFVAMCQYLGRTYDPALPHLLELSGRTPLQKTCLFGKHRGQLWEDVPKDYMEWILNRQGAIERGRLKEPSFPDEVIAACKQQLGISETN